MSAEPRHPECVTLGNAIVCYGARNVYMRRCRRCWTCGVMTPHLIRWDGLWYGYTIACMVCADEWQDGWRAPRPFARYWKRDRLARLQKNWNNALSPRDFKAFVKAEHDDYFNDEVPA